MHTKRYGFRNAWPIPSCRLVALVALLNLVCTVAAADSYFDAALSKIEQTLVRPPETYGLVVTDTYNSAMLKNLGPVRVRYSFFTSEGKVQYRLERFDPGASDKLPYLKHVMVIPADPSTAQAADVARGKRTLNVDLKLATLGIGEEDPYMFAPTAEENSARPDRQPFQALANPCFAPLKITPLELRKMSVKALPDEDGCKVFQAEKKQNDYLVVLRLYFSPKWGDSLVKSVWGIAKPDDPEMKFLRRTVRKVEKWQTLPGGTLVPMRFTLVREESGETAMSMVREISNPAIGAVDENLFVISKVPELNVEWDQKIDVKRALAEGPAAGITKAMPAKVGSLRVVLIAINFAAVLILVSLLVYRRRRRSVLAG